MSINLLQRNLNQSDEQAFITACNSWGTPELAKRWFSCWDPSTSFGDLITKLYMERKGVVLQEGFVPCHTLYAFIGGGFGDTIIGRLSIRHKLTDALQRYGGHIGYAVLPKYRGQGYASEMLYRSLGNCRYLGLKEVLLTIANDNLASIAVAKKCGAVFADEFYDEEHKRTTQRWTIKV